MSRKNTIRLSAPALIALFMSLIQFRRKQPSDREVRRAWSVLFQPVDTPISGNPGTSHRRSN